MKFQQLKNIHHQDSKQFFLISGPCVVESEQMCMDIAGKVLEICDEFKIPYIFKASYRKANRTRVDSYTGIGDQLGLDILKKFQLIIIFQSPQISIQKKRRYLQHNL